MPGEQFTRRQLGIPDRYQFTKYQINKHMFEWIKDDIWEYKKEL